MENEWDIARDSLSQITVVSNPENKPVTVFGHSDDLKCVGVGTDAAVFQNYYVPSYAFKVYAEDKISKINVEKNIYDMLEGSPYFPKCFAAYNQYLVLSYEKGTTLFDCLLQGIHIPKQAVKDVDDAREYVREKDLNPRDMHLKNILLQNGRAKVIDVSEYIQPGNDRRWEHLKQGYESYYHLIDGTSIPFWLAETIRKWYNQRHKYFSSFDEFMRNILKLTTFKK
ncbi:serine/threonine protein kinase [Lentibacillus amyloliquefaciens]|uniref:Serine/threonine protein kinase n=1 Tax=Lentibacillus amyloliquefaciens TaxID=1472767 RepID=A0A0U4F5H6_9BACI|nr:serine/threonine protein kinase [Lentibacillus amyloliquefaciens]ALX48854.1 serine/threonine protein kinase [Lentibacillus amyloliquefaciens]